MLYPTNTRLTIKFIHYAKKFSSTRMGIVKDLVSIITPCYNSQAFISQTIESVLAQKYPHWEMIIADNNSCDCSTDIILSYIKKDDRIKLIQLPKSIGVDEVRNVAIRAAKGRYIAFLDGDDLWLPEKLDVQLKFMESRGLLFTYSSYQLTDENNRYLGEFITKRRITYERLLKTCDIGCLTAIYDTKKLGKIYMPDALRREDYALWLQILKKTGAAQGIRRALAIYRIRKQSLSSNKLKMAACQWSVYRKNERLNWFRSVYYFFYYGYYGLLKYRQ